ncbi:RNA 2',3'-cyclic phosphodiesterase [Streptomyces scopuliridis]|uniref:RNA 2',3'-cyclic phosphodiesterase n=1 Tax=Streptomyces scopuliridis TaxID=452529 RepID=A0ACD4ZM67_9ACTN|nr:RNA 2',3'-cyclic phosphodiesterase [Streptomyces scopuliridis]WSB99473.1 RNA 2',3'-cyclic phosphodiesterase [Streptomyces scopuliridis]WSC06827.1 RNA 2',3'-cyclic phosphodiesterase [Streptomyces scopuliridis]
MRLFAAVLPPPEAVEELARAVDRLRGLPGADGLRWTGRDGWHFTLAFMGEVEDGLLPELTERLERAARRTEPFPLRIHGGGHFGGRFLWAGAAGGIGELRRLAERADAAARRAGVPMEEHRHYQAHLTLARGRGGRGGRTDVTGGAVTGSADPARRGDVDVRPYAEALGGFEGTPWEVAELVLVRSRLPVSGVPGEQPLYEAVARRPLGRGHPGNPGVGAVTPGR